MVLGSPLQSTWANTHWDKHMRCCEKNSTGAKTATSSGKGQTKSTKKSKKNQNKTYFATCPQTMRQCSEHKTFHKSLDLIEDESFVFPQLLLLHSRLDESYVFKKKTNQNKKNTHIQADEDQFFVCCGESRQPIRSWAEMSSLKTTSWSSNKKTTPMCSRVL